jgi:hypothetical protein
MILTRFLYAKDEVELSLLTALLKKDDLKIVYYWAYELYYSGFEDELFDLLWKFYLDFYYANQPYFLTYLKKKHDLWKVDKDKNVNHVAYILRNMYNLKADGGVFMIRQRFALDLSPTILYRCQNKTMVHKTMVNKTMVHLTGTGYDKQYHNLLLALERKHFENIWYHLKSLLNKGATPSQVVAGFLKVDIIIIDNCLSVHYLLAVIYKALFATTVGVNDIKEKHIYVVPKLEHLDEMLKLEKELIPLTKKGNAQIYNTLPFKRMVSIDDHIGSFALARWQYESLQREHWFRWEFYAMGSPLWMKRLDKYGGKVNHDLRKIKFATDADEEAFYGLYAYELDELPKEVQAMSMKPLFKNNGSAWFNYVFGTDVSISAGECESWQWIY